MKYLTKKLWISLLTIVISLSAFTIQIEGTIIGTDSSNDVVNVSWNQDGISWSTKTNQAKPEIDITDVEYGPRTNDGNMTISLSVVGTPVFNNQTFYLISLIGEDSLNNNFSLIIWAGGYLGYNQEKQSSLLFTEDTGSLIISETLVPLITGSKIIFTLPKVTTFFNSTTFQQETIDLPLPDTPNNEWGWLIQSWTGDEAFSSNKGNWYVDYFPDTDNPYISKASNTDTSGTDSTGASSPGFEIISVLAGAFVAGVIINKKGNK